ncbi:hypothetical protein NC652_022746 [Populus alba x Populus x berolinensis]|nr:hypothetical protein NC652_022746 [Populus alba x Populus x berolinensis]
MIKQLRQQIKPSMEELPGLEFGTTSCTDLIQEQQGTTSLISFAVELQRRGQLNDNYKTLRNLIKNPSTKEDRATVIRDAIKYIIQLIRAVYELKQLVEKKSIGPSFSKNHSWVQRKSKDTEIDVSIIADEVTIKVLHRKKKNNYCLLFVSRINGGSSSANVHTIAGKLIEVLDSSCSK